MGDADQQTYAAGQARELLRGELPGKEQPELVREFAGLVNDQEVLELLNYYAGLWEDHRPDQEFVDTRLYQLVASSAATQSIDEAFREGNVSQLQGAVGLTNQGGDQKDALMRMASSAADEGFIGLVVGAPGSGKTATTLDVARMWKTVTGGTVVSNLDPCGPADAVVKDSEELRDLMGENQGQVLAVLDEAAQDLTSRGGDQVASNEFAKQLKLIRKKDPDDRYPKQGSAILIGQTRSDVAADLRRLATEMWEKPSRRDQGLLTIYESDGGRDSFDRVGEFRGLTDTQENYDPHDPAEFHVVLEDDEGDQEDQDGHGEGWEQAAAAAIRACQPWSDDEGMSYGDAADLIPFSSSWVGERCREWRDGAHRELVTGPDETD